MCAHVCIYVCVRARVCVKHPGKAKAHGGAPSQPPWPRELSWLPPLSASPVLVVGIFLVEALILGLHVTQAGVVIRVNKRQVNLGWGGGRHGAAVDQASGFRPLFTPPPGTWVARAPEPGSPVPTSRLLPQLIQLQPRPPTSPPAAFPAASCTPGPTPATPYTAFCAPSNTALTWPPKPSQPCPTAGPGPLSCLQPPQPSSLGPGAQNHPASRPPHGLWVL